MRTRSAKSSPGSRPLPGAAAFLAALALWPVAAPAADVRPRLAPRPSSRRYVPLDAVAREVRAVVDVDPRTCVHRVSRGRLAVAVVPGVAAMLVGPRLVELDREAIARYSRAYVPAGAVAAIRRYFEAAAPAAAPPLVRPPPTPPSGPTPSYLVRICIDPGHGGKDPGGISRRRLYEKHVVLPTSELLAAELRKRGFQTVMTRDRDVFIELEDRPAIAARHGADAFVSVHANIIANRSIHGAEIFYSSTQYDAPARAAAAARAGRKPPPEDVGGPKALPPGASQAVLEMLFEEYHRESRELAYALRGAFQGAGIHVHSVRSCNFKVLRLSETPAVLVEVGFLTNRAEEAKLRTTSYRQKLARVIADGIQAYRRTLERSRGLSN